MGAGANKMRIKLMLLLILALPLIARADTFNFTFSANQAQCARLGVTGPCTDSGSGTFTTGPLTLDINHPLGAYPITSMTGTIDGFAMSFLPSSGAIESNGGFGKLQQICCAGPVLFSANNQQWAFVRFDVGPQGQDAFLFNGSFGEPINLTITAPEPSTLLFLGIGLLGLIGLTLFKNRLS
jgi:hypothetical protein